MTRTRLLIAVVCGAAVVAAGPPPADAERSVPPRSYTCHGETGRVIGTLRIKSKSEYRYRGEGGKYEYSGGDAGFLHFHSGPLLGWLGRLRKSGGDPMIRLVQLRAEGRVVKCLS